MTRLFHVNSRSVMDTCAPILYYVNVGSVGELPWFLLNSVWKYHARPLIKIKSPAQKDQGPKT